MVLAASQFMNAILLLGSIDTYDHVSKFT